MLASGITTLQVGSLVSYLIAFGLPCFDAVVPILPSETVIIAFGVATAGSSDPRIFLILVCAAATQPLPRDHSTGLPDGDMIPPGRKFLSRYHRPRAGS